MSSVFDPEGPPPTKAQIIAAWCVLGLCALAFGAMVWAAVQR